MKYSAVGGADPNEVVLKITDFAFSRLWPPDREFTTSTVTVVGSEYFMAPEVARPYRWSQLPLEAQYKI